MIKLCPNCKRIHGEGKLGRELTPRSWCPPCASLRKSAPQRQYLAEISLRDMLDYLLDSKLPDYVEDYVVDLNNKLSMFGQLTDAQEDLIRRTYAKAQRNR